MIRPLRRYHLCVFKVLGVVLPLLFVIGVARRRAIPQTENLPADMPPRTVTFTPLDYQRADLFEKNKIQVRLWREKGTEKLAAGFKAPKNFLKPDLLAYWSAARPADISSLPKEATLLGAFVAGPLSLPPEASSTEGYLVLYSLANQEVVDVSRPTKFRDSITSN